MAKAKKEDIQQEEILEQEIKTEKSVKPEPVKDPYADLKAKVLARTAALQEQRRNMIKLYCKTDTPYLKEPNVNTNVTGIVQKGTMLYAEEIIDNGPSGVFYKINDKMYVNTKWDFEVF